MTKIRFRLVWTLVGICLLPAPAIAGAIRGTLRAPAARPSPAGSARDSAMDAVVYLEEIPEKLEKKLAKTGGTARIAQRDGRFIPRVTPVVAGTTVRFVNRDNVYHNVFSVSPARPFDVGKYAPHTSRQVTFDKPGVVELFCDIDPNEIGFVVIVPNHAFTRPDAAGAFRLPNLRPGSYRLTVWRPDQGPRTLDVQVPRRGDVSLSLGR